jgi:hypothetical protein
MPQWAIGIYAGASPLSLAPAAGAANPVLRGTALRNLPAAAFVADPFMLRQGDLWHMFFEVWNEDTGRGEIAHATSRDARRWDCTGVVLRESFHLSYPHVFNWQGDCYMTPETLGAGCIRLYRARRFPDRWECAAELVAGALADPTPCRFDGRWWLFACPNPATHDALALYGAARLEGPWQEHPASPIVTGDARRARPAGRVTPWNGGLLRFAQDCYPAYGTGVRALRVTEISPDAYREEEAAESPVLAPGEAPWCAQGMHHLDAHLLPDGSWIACVDGRPPATAQPPATVAP